MFKIHHYYMVESSLKCHLYKYEAGVFTLGKCAQSFSLSHLVPTTQGYKMVEIEALGAFVCRAAKAVIK